jgi:ATP-dependent protease ClpP protease subunit
MTGHIFVYGAIGTGMGEVSLKSIKAQIDAEKEAKDYVLHVFSPGGDVFEGYGIYNALKNTGKEITTQIEGLCASIATLIAFAGNKIVMNRTSEFMIHNPKITDLKGDAYDLRNAANQLDKIKNILVDVASARAARNGKPINKEQLWALYDNETWLNAQETQQMGFADEVVDAIKAVAKVNINTMEKKEAWLTGVFKNLLGLSKIKNQMEETLADGRKIMVMSDDEDWTGKQVVTESGEALEPGEHQLVSGKVIVVGENSTITEVKEAPAPEDKNNEEMDNKIKELENQLAQAKADKEQAEAKAKTAETEALQAKASVAKIENRMTEFEKKYLKLAEDLGKTVGDNTPPPKGPVFKNADGKDEVYDPMGEEFRTSLKARNLI